MIFFNKKKFERKPLSVLIEHFGIMLIASGIIVASFCFSPEDLENRNGLAKVVPKCMFKEITGLPCPSCGMSRAFASISRGNFYLAFRYNPLSLLLYPLILSGVVIPPASLIHYYLGRKKISTQNCNIID